MADSNTRPTIVVGVDGSEDSIEALRWAAVQARLSGSEVHAVTGWQVPITVMVVPSYSTEDYARDAEEQLRKSVHDALGDDPDIPIVTRLVQKHPARALVAEAEDADMIVLGRHGHGRRTAPWNRRLVLHSPCSMSGRARSVPQRPHLGGPCPRKEELMERVLETLQFGSHRVVVLEHAGDDETTYSVLVDNIPATDTPLPSPPNLEDVVRIYTRAMEQRV